MGMAEKAAFLNGIEKKMSSTLTADAMNQEDLKNAYRRFYV